MDLSTNILIMKAITKFFEWRTFMCVFIWLSSSMYSQTSTVKNGFDLRDAMVPQDEILSGGPPRDGIPSIDQPEFIQPTEARMGDGKRILGVEVNGIAKAYPIHILNYHEIVNDQFGHLPVVITYCPLCGSGIAFNAEVDGKRKTFGVSGLLYNSDVLLYDRETESLWSQIIAEAITGEEMGKKLQIIPTSNTTWGEWRQKYPESLVLSSKTGFSRNYEMTPYQGYDDSKRLYFPVKEKSQDFHPKEKVLGIKIGEVAKAYPFSVLEKTQNGLVMDQVNGVDVVITYNKEAQSASIRNSEGEALGGITLFWFAWYAFHPDTVVFGED